MPSIVFMEDSDFVEVVVWVRCGFPDEAKGKTLEEHVDAIFERLGDSAERDDVVAEAEAMIDVPCGGTYDAQQTCLACPWGAATVRDVVAPDEDGAGAMAPKRIGFTQAEGGGV